MLLAVWLRCWASIKRSIINDNYLNKVLPIEKNRKELKFLTLTMETYDKLAVSRCIAILHMLS